MHAILFRTIILLCGTASLLNGADNSCPWCTNRFLLPQSLIEQYDTNSVTKQPFQRRVEFSHGQHADTVDIFSDSAGRIIQWGRYSAGSVSAGIRNMYWPDGLIASVESFESGSHYGRQLNFFSPATSVTQYQYNAEGSVTSVWVNDGQGGVSMMLSSSTEYDPRGRKSLAQRYSGGILLSQTSFEYGDTSSLVRKLTTIYFAEPDTSSILYEYDSNGRQVRQLWYHSTGELSASWEYAYDAAGNQTKVDRYDSLGLLASRSAYSFDALGRKTKDIRYVKSSAVNDTYDLAYDGFGNKSTRLNGWLKSYQESSCDAQGRIISRTTFSDYYTSAVRGVLCPESGSPTSSEIASTPTLLTVCDDVTIPAGSTMWLQIQRSRTPLVETPSGMYLQKGDSLWTPTTRFMFDTTQASDIRFSPMTAQWFQDTTDSLVRLFARVKFETQGIYFVNTNSYYLDPMRITVADNTRTSSVLPGAAISPRTVVRFSKDGSATLGLTLANSARLSIRFLSVDGRTLGLPVTASCNAGYNRVCVQTGIGRAPSGVVYAVIGTEGSPSRQVVRIPAMRP